MSDAGASSGIFDGQISSREPRFRFGRNWTRFLNVVDPTRIAAAEASLVEMLGLARLDGKRFLDVGSGSGLFSLAARRLGATVRSFDNDPDSVACTRLLKDRYVADDPGWTVEQGSVLDERFVAGLGIFDVVYAWGVLHHTGSMWRAMGNLTPLTGPGGYLYVAVYNDQGRASRRWRVVKRLYNTVPGFARWTVLVPAFVRLWGPTAIRDLSRGRPSRSWRADAERGRGMSPWRDVVDWVGGYPFEVAKPEEVFDFYHARGFSLHRLKTCGGGLGCNEYVFVKGG